MPTLATFNANNFFIRYKFSRVYPGDEQNKKSLDEASAATGFVPGAAFGEYPSTSYIVWDSNRRDLATYALSEPDGTLPDILCFQEVEGIEAIRILNDRYFSNFYDYSFLLDAYDPRNIDVGILSRYPIVHVRSHIDRRTSIGEQLFKSRDCLEVDIDIPGSKTLTLFVNHLKSKFVDRRKHNTPAKYQAEKLKGHKKRLRQSEEIMKIIAERFDGEHTTALYAVIGDLNDTAYSPWVAPLFNSPRLTDLVATHIPQNERWTYWWRSKNRASQIDFILASRALASRVESTVNGDNSKKPHIERSGLAYREWSTSGETLPKEANLLYLEDDGVTPTNPNAPDGEKVGFRFPRYDLIIQDYRNNISDHCPVKVWF